jgi:hypothetical protein
MLLIERFGHESDAEFEQHLEILYARVPREASVSFDTGLTRFQADYPRAREWRRPFRVGRRAGWSGRAFCEVECLFASLYMHLVQAVENGIARDALVIEHRGSSATRECPRHLTALAIHNGVQREIDLAELTPLSYRPEENERPYPEYWDDGRFRLSP